MIKSVVRILFLAFSVVLSGYTIIISDSLAQQTPAAQQSTHPSATSANQPAANFVTPSEVTVDADKSQKDIANRKASAAGINFTPTKFENIVKLAWAKGAYDVSDVAAVNMFLSITECNLYHKFFQNEFEWARISKSTKSYLQTYGSEIPKYYEYVQPISLKRYDFKLRGFPLENNSIYDPTYVLQISDNKSEKNSCGDKFSPSKKFPTSAVMRIKSPFSLSFLHVPEEIAKEYLAFVDQQSALKVNSSRTAFVRFQIEVTGLERVGAVGSTPYFIFVGNLLRIDAFADKELLLPLYSQKF